MTSKTPIRSCEDMDETALSYAEIKALCAGDPRIREKMELDNDVARLRMLKSEHDSSHYRLEDNLLKHYPQQITAITERITGIEGDISVYKAQKEKCVEVTTTEGAASVTAKFPGMILDGVTYTEKEPAAKALLEACKSNPTNKSGAFMNPRSVQARIRAPVSRSETSEAIIAMKPMRTTADSHGLSRNVTTRTVREAVTDSTGTMNSGRGLTVNPRRLSSEVF